MALATMKDLLEAGVHFGHPTRRWNPKMRGYIYHARNDIYIIDLHQTLRLLEEAYDFVRSLAEQGETVLFTGTKRQAQDTIEEQAQRCGMPYVNKRWLGGMLTNFQTIRQRVRYLESLIAAEESGEWRRLELLRRQLQEFASQPGGRPRPSDIHRPGEHNLERRRIGGVAYAHAGLCLLSPQKQSYLFNSGQNLRQTSSNLRLC